MTSLEISNGYTTQDIGQQKEPVPEEEEPALALDLRINCVSASVSIFDDENVLCQMQSGVQKNEARDSDSLSRNLINYGSFPKIKEEKQNSSEPDHYQMPNNRPQLSYFPFNCLLHGSSHQPIISGTSLTQDKVQPNPLLHDVQQYPAMKSPQYARFSTSKEMPQANHTSSQSSSHNFLSGSSQFNPSRGSYYSPRAPHPSTLIQRDRSRSPLSQDFGKPGSNRSMSPEHDYPFDHSPSSAQLSDEIYRNRYNGYIHKRYNARSLFLSRVIQRQQDYYSHESPPQSHCPSNILPPEISQSEQRLKHIRPECFSEVQQPQPRQEPVPFHPNYSNAVCPRGPQHLPPVVLDIDSKIRRIEESLTGPNELLRKMESRDFKMREEIRQYRTKLCPFPVRNIAEDFKLHEIELRNAEILAKQPTVNRIGFKAYPQYQSQRRRSPSPVRAHSTLPLNLSKEDGLIFQSAKMYPPLPSRHYSPPPKPPPVSWAPYSLSNSRSPSPTLLSFSTKIKEEKETDFAPYEGLLTSEKPGKSRRGRPRKHVRKIPLPPLYVFIRNLLHNQSYNPKIVSWVNEAQGIFKVNHTIEFAKTWGSMKSHRSEEMNYEKMSRAMRYHYGGPGRKGHLAMVKEKRLVYKFGELAINWHAGDVQMAKCDLHELCKGCLCLWTKE